MAEAVVRWLLAAPGSVTKTGRRIGEERAASSLHEDVKTIITFSHRMVFCGMSQTGGHKFLWRDAEWRVADRETSRLNLPCPTLVGDFGRLAIGQGGAFRVTRFGVSELLDCACSLSVCCWAC
jgi:hypothetical protein